MRAHSKSTKTSVGYRALRLFAALLVFFGISVTLTWWHHTRTLSRCATSASIARDPVACHAGFWLFGISWAGLATFLFTLFGVCLFLSWGWSLTRRERS